MGPFWEKNFIWTYVLKVITFELQGAKVLRKNSFFYNNFGITLDIFLNFGTHFLYIKVHFLMYKQFYYFYQWRLYGFWIEYFWRKICYATAFSQSKNYFWNPHSFLSKCGPLIFFRLAYGFRIKKIKPFICI